MYVGLLRVEVLIERCSNDTVRVRRDSEVLQQRINVSAVPA